MDLGHDIREKCYWLGHPVLVRLYPLKVRDAPDEMSENYLYNEYLGLYFSVWNSKRIVRMADGGGAEMGALW